MPNTAIPSNQRLSESALRFDSGKLRMDLLPPDAISELAKVYTFGAQKYADRNWEKGMSWSRVVASLLRHTFSWMAGETYDPESGIHHMAHVAWNALTLISYCLRNVGADDRGPECPNQPVPSTSSSPTSSSQTEMPMPRY